MSCMLLSIVFCTGSSHLTFVYALWFSGMIDSPGGNQEIMDRGYDFPGVVRWFASRADIVLMFFDPDKVRS